MLIIAIDCALCQTKILYGTRNFNSVAWIYNALNHEQRFERLATDRGFFQTLSKTYNPEIDVADACGASGWISELYGGLGLEVIACSTHDDGWLFESVKPASTTPSNLIENASR